MDRDEAERSELEEIRRAWERGRPFRGNVRTIIIDGRVCHMPNDDD